jgi:hypothetical protein
MNRKILIKFLVRLQEGDLPVARIVAAMPHHSIDIRGAIDY